MNIHEKYMKCCMELAQNGMGKVAPNPMVGCVVVHKDKIIGKGYHEKYGFAHAEVNAINSVETRNLASLREATLYVNIEPCSHFGKTPPCADLIIKTGFKYVVIGTLDPNSLVTGRGLQKLVSSGCDVKVGILEKECRELNKRFFTFHEKKRPYVILKWAQTKDKYMGITNCRLQITGHETAKLVHQWRGEEQSIMVGTNTALTDNPKLTIRKAKGSNPTRILIDRQLKIPSSFHLLDGSVPTIVFTSRKIAAKKNLEYVVVDFKKDTLKQVMQELHHREIQSLIVEGGVQLLTSFIENDLWDEAKVFTAEKSLSVKADGRGAPMMKAKRVGSKKVGSDLLELYDNRE